MVVDPVYSRARVLSKGNIQMVEAVLLAKVVEAIA